MIVVRPSLGCGYFISFIGFCQNLSQGCKLIHTLSHSSNSHLYEKESYSKSSKVSGNTENRKKFSEINFYFVA